MGSDRNFKKKKKEEEKKLGDTPGMVVRTFNSSTWEAEAGGSLVSPRTLAMTTQWDHVSGKRKEWREGARVGRREGQGKEKRKLGEVISHS